MGGRVAKLQNRRPVKTPKRQNHDFLAFAGSQNLTILKKKISVSEIIDKSHPPEPPDYQQNN